MNLKVTDLGMPLPNKTTVMANKTARVLSLVKACRVKNGHATHSPLCRAILSALELGGTVDSASDLKPAQFIFRRFDPRHHQPGMTVGPKVRDHLVLG
ncbi:hypothetical protein PoB_002082400 [Plakobranchus ocellatus]|uniref:Uncharacterized protein n=1 Tax=Plakobranchus ocellatus TaxID=259542 RepID=A0AAV3ZG52_9GAST|nr:hypothetical protein PoB_002082400 [Plakobranchus ocellatus]